MDRKALREADRAKARGNVDTQSRVFEKERHWYGEKPAPKLDQERRYLRSMLNESTRRVLIPPTGQFCRSCVGLGFMIENLMPVSPRLFILRVASAEGRPHLM